MLSPFFSGIELIIVDAQDDHAKQASDVENLMQWDKVPVPE